MDDDCHLSTELHDSILLQCVRWLQLFIKILFANIVIYSIGLGVTQVAHVIARNTAVIPCDAQIPKEMCLFRMMAASVTPAFVFIHVSITIQQALSSFRYPLRVQKRVARLTVFITLCYVIAFGVFAFSNETLTGRTPFCSSFNPKSEIFIIANLNVLMILDVANFICAIILLRYNKKILSTERNSFELTLTFKRVQILYAMEQFIPIIAIHSISHFIHFCLYSFSFYTRPNYTQTQFTILYAAVNIMPYYCLFSPLAFLILTKLGRFRRKDHVKNMIAPMQNSNTQDAYFKTLRDSWNKPI